MAEDPRNSRDILVIRTIKSRMSVSPKEDCSGWRDGLEVKSTDCSSKGPGVDSQEAGFSWLLTTVCNSSSRGADNALYKDTSITTMHTT